MTRTSFVWSTPGYTVTVNQNQSLCTLRYSPVGGLLSPSIRGFLRRPLSGSPSDLSVSWEPLGRQTSFLTTPEPDFSSWISPTLSRSKVYIKTFIWTLLKNYLFYTLGSVSLLSLHYKSRTLDFLFLLVNIPTTPDSLFLEIAPVTSQSKSSQLKLPLPPISYLRRPKVFQPSSKSDFYSRLLRVVQLL